MRDKREVDKEGGMAESSEVRGREGGRGREGKGREGKGREGKGKGKGREGKGREGEGREGKGGREGGREGGRCEDLYTMYYYGKCCSCSYHFIL